MDQCILLIRFVVITLYHGFIVFIWPFCHNWCFCLMIHRCGCCFAQFPSVSSTEEGVDNCMQSTLYCTAHVWIENVALLKPVRVWWISAGEQGFWRLNFESSSTLRRICYEIYIFCYTFFKWLSKHQKCLEVCQTTEELLYWSLEHHLKIVLSFPS